MSISRNPVTRNEIRKAQYDALTKGKLLKMPRDPRRDNLGKVAEKAEPEVKKVDKKVDKKVTKKAKK